MGYELSDYEWSVIKRCWRTSRAAFPAWITGAFSTASFGSCDQVRRGAIYRRVLSGAGASGITDHTIQPSLQQYAPSARSGSGSVSRILANFMPRPWWSRAEKPESGSRRALFSLGTLGDTVSTAHRLVVILAHDDKQDVSHSQIKAAAWMRYTPPSAQA